MTLRIVGTSPSGEPLKTTLDAGEHVIHVAVDSGGGGGTVNQGAAGAAPWLVSDAALLAQLQTLNALVPSVYDYVFMTYVANNMTSAVFRNGGAAGAIVSTLTMTYDASDNLLTVTKT